MNIIEEIDKVISWLNDIASVNPDMLLRDIDFSKISDKMLIEVIKYLLKQRPEITVKEAIEFLRKYKEEILEEKKEDESFSASAELLEETSWDEESFDSLSSLDWPNID